MYENCQKVGKRNFNVNICNEHLKIAPTPRPKGLFKPPPTSSRVYRGNILKLPTQPTNTNSNLSHPISLTTVKIVSINRRIKFPAHTQITGRLIKLPRILIENFTPQGNARESIPIGAVQSSRFIIVRTEKWTKVHDKGATVSRNNSTTCIIMAYGR